MTESEPSYARPGQNKASHPWFIDNFQKHNLPETQKLLEEYSGIPRDQQRKHLDSIRDQAWAIRTYPCTGLGHWLVPYLARSPARNDIVNRLKSGASILDIGCFLGSDFRQLAYDGAPTDRMYGVDIVSHWDVGRAMYRDETKFHATFIEADILSTDNAQLNALHGKMDVISISAVLHQWTRDQQVRAGRVLTEFASGVGALVVGYQIGNVNSGEVTLKGVTAFRHDPDSFAKMWKEIGDETGTVWESRARLQGWAELGFDPDDYKWMDPGDRILSFEVERIN